MLFADDCIVFHNASMEEGLRVTKIPEDYEKESGQKLNREKTSLFFSKNTSMEVKEEVKGMFEPKSSTSMRNAWGSPLW